MRRPKKSRVVAVVWIETPPEVKEAWQEAAEASGLSLRAWVMMRCNGTQLEAHPPILPIPSRKAA